MRKTFISPHTLLIVDDLRKLNHICLSNGLVCPKDKRFFLLFDEVRKLGWWFYRKNLAAKCEKNVSERNIHTERSIWLKKYSQIHGMHLERDSNIEDWMKFFVLMKMTVTSQLHINETFNTFEQTMSFMFGLLSKKPIDFIRSFIVFFCIWFLCCVLDYIETTQTFLIDSSEMKEAWWVFHFFFCPSICYHSHSISICSKRQKRVHISKRFSVRFL